MGRVPNASSIKYNMLTMSLETIILISYLVVGLIVSLCLLLTWRGRKKDLHDAVDKHGWMIVVFPCYAIVALVFWPVYLAVRIWHLFWEKRHRQSLQNNGSDQEIAHQWARNMIDEKKQERASNQ